MDIVTLQDPRLLTWLNARLSTQFEEASCRWVAGLADGSIVFVVVYSTFSRRSCELTIATDETRRWATKRTLHHIFRIPFVEWSLRRVMFVARADNTVSLDMIERLGAEREGQLRRHFSGDVDGVLFGMLREECRWC